MKKILYRKMTSKIGTTGSYIPHNPKIKNKNDVIKILHLIFCNLFIMKTQLQISFLLLILSSLIKPELAQSYAISKSSNF